MALAYITGILPIKKIKDESALNNFTEFTMIDSYPITRFFGFTEDEVKQLCEQFQLDMDNTKVRGGDRLDSLGGAIRGMIIDND